MTDKRKRKGFHLYLTPEQADLLYTIWYRGIGGSSNGPRALLDTVGAKLRQHGAQDSEAFYLEGIIRIHGTSGDTPDDPLVY